MFLGRYVKKVLLFSNLIQTQRFINFQTRKFPFAAALDLTTVYPRDEVVLPRPESKPEVPRRKPTGRKAKQHRILSRKFDLEGHSGAIYCAEFSPCGQFLATGSLDKSIR